MSKQEGKVDHCGKIMKYKTLVKRNKVPTPDYHKKTVRPIQFRRPRPIPKLKKLHKPKLKRQKYVSFDDKESDALQYNPYRSYD